MSLVRISTTGPEQTCSLWNVLAKRGLNVVILSATEIGIECDELSENLNRELEWARAQVQGTIVPAESVAPKDLPPASLEVHSSSHENEPAEDAGDQADWMAGYVPEREFVLAPYWRRIKAALVNRVGSFSRTDRSPFAEPTPQNAQISVNRSTWFTNAIGFVRDAIKRAGHRLQDAEERILEESQAGDLRREDAEASVWSAAESEGWPTPPQTAGRFFNVKVFAFLGGAAMAGLILVGLSLAHRSSAPISTDSDKTSAATRNASDSRESPATGALPSNPANPVHESAVAGMAAKPSPSTSVRSAANSHAGRQRIRRAARDAATGDEQEVITRYYRRNAPRANRASSDGVKHYSDLN